MVKKELSDEELDLVSGGKIGTDDPHFPNFSGFVNMYCLKENQLYYFVKGNDNWFRGVVQRTYEKSTGIFGLQSLRTHVVTLVELGTLTGDWQPGYTITVCGDDTAVYETKIN